MNTDVFLVVVSKFHQKRRETAERNNTLLCSSAILKLAVVDQIIKAAMSAVLTRVLTKGIVKVIKRDTVVSERNFNVT